MLILVWVTRLYFHTQLLSDTTTGDVFAHILLQNGVKVGLSNHRTSARALGLLGKFGAEAVEVKFTILRLGASLKFLPVETC